LQNSMVNLRELEEMSTKALCDLNIFKTKEGFFIAQPQQLYLFLDKILTFFNSKQAKLTFKEIESDFIAVKFDNS